MLFLMFSPLPTKYDMHIDSMRTTYDHVVILSVKMKHHPNLPSG